MTYYNVGDGKTYSTIAAAVSAIPSNINGTGVHCVRLYSKSGGYNETDIDLGKNGNSASDYILVKAEEAVTISGSPTVAFFRLDEWSRFDGENITWEVTGGTPQSLIQANDKWGVHVYNVTAPDTSAFTNGVIFLWYKAYKCQVYDNRIVGSNIDVAGIRIRASNPASTYEPTIIERNFISLNGSAHGIRLEDNDMTSQGFEWHVRNNIVENCGDGINFNPVDSPFYAYHNTIYNCTQGFYTYRADLSDIYIKNNIIHTCSSYGLYIAYDNTPTSTEIDYNIVYNASKYGYIEGADKNTLSDWQSAGYGANSDDGDPNLNNPAGGDTDNGDFDLTGASSNAQDLGVDVGVSDDFHGETRTGTPDIGADEITAIDETNDRDFELTGTKDESRERDFELIGKVDVEKERDFVLHGVDTASPERGFELTGEISPTSEVEFSLHGRVITNEEIGFELEGSPVVWYTEDEEDWGSDDERDWFSEQDEDWYHDEGY